MRIHKLKLKFFSICFITIFTLTYLLFSNTSNIENSLGQNMEENELKKEWINNEIAPKIASIENFLYFKNITIHHEKISGIVSLVNFTVLLDIYDSDLRDYTQTEGDDIAFFNGTIQLDHEIVEYNYNFNNTHAHLKAWIKIPNLSPLNDTIIQMYFGNPTIESQENPEGVWEAEYKSVWHLEEDPNEQIKDSSKYENHGTAYGMNSNDLIPCVIENGLNFTGSGKYINCGNDDSLDLTAGLTIEFWIFPNTTKYIYPNGRIIIDKGAQYRLTQRWNISTQKETLQFTIGGGVTFFFPAINLNTWNHFVLVSYEAGGNTTAISYLNGQSTGSNRYDGEIIEKTTAPLYISNQSNGAVSSLDEIRLSNVTRSAEWINTTYENQNNPISFYSVGQKEKIFTYNIKPLDFKYSKIFTINHTKVNGSGVHKNFPVLLDLLDKDLHRFAQPDGRDIVFHNGTDWLDFEIEYYNHSYYANYSKLVAWIRIPFLSTSKNTNFTMYFGNSSIISQQNPLEVWNSNYMGVWHLKENPSEVIKDSSIYHNDGQTYGSMTSDNLIEGKIDGALNFDGINDYINVGNHSSLDFIFTDKATMEAWILPLDNGSNQYLINKYDSGEFSYRISFSEGQIRATGGVPGTDFKSNDRLSLNSWQHVAVVINNGEGKIYINGKLNCTVGPGTQFLSSQPNNDVIFGCGWFIQPSVSYFYNGSLDEIRISNVERSADWIATQYNNQFDIETFFHIGCLKTSPGPFQLDSNATSPETDGLFTLNWSISNGAKNYSIYWHTSWISYYSGDLNLLDEGLTNNSRSVQFSNGTYYFIVISFNETGFTLSNCIEVIIQLLPGVFTILCDALDPDTDGIFFLNWTNSAWTKNYSIYYYINSFNEVHENVSLLDEGLTNNSRLITFPRGIFYFRVMAFNDVGSTISSNEIMVNINLPPDNFILSANMSSLDENGSIILNWTKSDGALNYSLYLSNSFIEEYNDNLTLIEEGLTNNSYRVHLGQSGTYYFLGIAFNEVGNYTAECFTLNIVVPNNQDDGDQDDDNQNNGNNNANNPLFLPVVIIIISSLAGILITGFFYAKSRSKLHLKDTRKEIPLKVIISHIDNIFKSGSGESIKIQKQIKTYGSESEPNEIDNKILKLKQTFIELFLNGAYLEALKKIKYALKYLREINKKEELDYFTEFYKKINTLVTDRDDKLLKLNIKKKDLNHNHQEIISLYEEIIYLSKELNDFDSMEMYKYELDNYLIENKLK